MLRAAFAWFALVLGTTTSAIASGPEDTRMEWWREARFGLFIHWGLYAVPAGEWNGATHHGEWIRESAHIPVEQYEKFLPQFNPVKFDAKEWASLAREAGMKYVVITSKHHDGFGLFDSKLTDWDVMSTPFRRDIMKELSDAVRAEGMTMCFYHSIMDWHHPDYLPRRSWENRPTDGADFSRFRKYLHGQVEELLTNYGPIGVMWFDGEWESTWNHEFGKALYDHCRKLQPSVIVNNRVDVGRAGMAGMTIEGTYCGDFGTPEQEVPAQGFPGVDWETCMTMNGHWGFNSHDESWKSSEELIRLLVDIASKGGNFLLNVGPRADGTFPPTCVERLRDMGRWMKTNGEAIYGTTASPFPKLAFGRATQKRSGATTTIYLCVFDWPKDGKLRVDGLGNEVRSARLLAAKDGKLAVASADGSVTIEVGSTAPDAACSVVELVVDGAPIVYEAPSIVAPAEAFVRELPVTFASHSPDLEFRYTLDGSAPTAESPKYHGAFRIANTTTVKARAFHAGKAVSAIVEKTFSKVTPRPAQNARYPAPGLLGAAIEGKFERMPTLDLKKGDPLVLREISLEQFKGRENYALRVDGYLEVDADDMYRFVLTSDDGARVWIDRQLLIDLDGLHSVMSKEGAMALAQGAHEIVIEYFNGTGNAELSLTMGTLEEDLAPIPPVHLSHAGGAR